MDRQTYNSFIVISVLLGLQGFWLPCRNGVYCLELISEPQNTMVHLKQTVVLNCVFDQLVDECQWRRNDWPFDMGGRYHYVQGEGKNTSTCSIKITDVDKIDFGTWMCIGTFGNDNNKTSVKSNPIKITDNKFVGVRENHNILLVDKVYLMDGNTLKVNCTLEGINQATASYLWEYRENSNTTWEVYTTEQTTTFSVLKLGFFRCSVIEGNSRYYSLEYLIAKSDDKLTTAGFISQRTTHLLVGFVIGMMSILGILLVAGYYIKKNYLITHERKKKHVTESEVQQKDMEMLPLLNNHADVRTTRKIDECSPGGTSFDWKIKNYEVKKTEEAAGKLACLLSEDFRVEGTDYSFQVKLYLNGFGEYKNSFMSILLNFIKHDQHANVNFHHKRKILLLDQSGNGRHMCWEHEPNYRSDEVQSWMKGSWGPVDFFPIANLKYDDQSFVRKGTILIRVIIEPLLTLTNHLTLEDNGQGFVWKIDNYYQRVQDEYDNFYKCLESEPFYCYPGGYRAKCLVYLNGCGKGRHKHISIFYGFLNGEHDNELPPAFSHRAVLRILDQSDLNRGRHIEKKVTLTSNDPASDEDADKMTEFYGFFTFAERKKIQLEPYLLDNSLLIQVAIKRLDKNMKRHLSRSSITSYSEETETVSQFATMGTDAV